MSDAVASSYDGLASEYHLLFADWDPTSARPPSRGRSRRPSASGYYQPILTARR
jgi:hypothetical protein